MEFLLGAVVLTIGILLGYGVAISSVKTGAAMEKMKDI